MLSNSFGGSAHGVVPAFFYRYPGRPRVGWRRYEPAPETSSLETVSSSGESANFRYRSFGRAKVVRGQDTNGLPRWAPSRATARRAIPVSRRNGLDGEADSSWYVDETYIRVRARAASPWST